MMTTPLTRDELMKEFLPSLSMLYVSCFQIMAALLSIVLGVFALVSALFQLVVALLGVVLWICLVLRTGIAKARQWADVQAQSYRL